MAAAPDSERGLAPSVLNLAFDLGVALDIVAGVRLGPGKISVHPAKLGLVGHGFGGSAAVFAAAGLTGTHVKSVAAIFPTVTNPAAEQPAATLDVPGLILTAPGDPKTLTSNALGLSRAWDKATLRIVSKARAGGLVEGRRLTKVLAPRPTPPDAAFGPGAADRVPVVHARRRQDLSQVRRSRPAAAQDGPDRP